MVFFKYHKIRFVAFLKALLDLHTVMILFPKCSRVAKSVGLSDKIIDNIGSIHLSKIENGGCVRLNKSAI